MAVIAAAAAADFKSMRYEQSIPEVFRARVRLHPDRLAIHSGDITLTYEELGRAVDAVGGAMLRCRGDAVERVVLLADQGVPAMIATLGALAIGAAYIPLDPLLPTAALRSQFECADPSLIVAARRYFDLARELSDTSAKVLCIEDVGIARSQARSDAVVGPDALAYIYFTSGSTGKPKGVCDNHRNVLHNVWRYTKNLGIGMDDRLTLLQAPHFSGAVSSMFCALLNGAASFPYDVRKEGLDRAADWLRSNRITIFHAVPAVFREVSVHGHFPDLRCVRLEGDRATARDIELFRRHCHAGSMLANGLGATECGLIRQWRIDVDTPIPDGPVPIGDPIDDMEILLVGDDRKEKGAGEIGEIAVRSRYLALGYWREPELTATKFLDDPSDSASRIYLTGDLGRMLAGGLLQYLGRKDFLPKVRGQWVDVDAVEQVLTAVPGVNDAVVSIREGPGGDPYVVAYVVADSMIGVRAEELRRTAAARLPAAMVPSAWVFLAKLPLTANLKVDRGALPDPQRQPASADFIAPRTPIEQALARIWSDVLGISPIGVDDNFFDLGGHSLLAVRAATKISRQLGVRIAVQRMAVETLAQTASSMTMTSGDGSDPKRSGWLDHPMRR
jgi:amino acid adenylation domain-containing protein